MTVFVWLEYDDLCANLTEVQKCQEHIEDAMHTNVLRIIS